MPPIRKGGRLPDPKSPTLTFTNQMNVATLAMLLSEHRGHHDPEARYYALLYSFLIYDNYAEEHMISRSASWGNQRCWLELARTPEVQALYAEILPWDNQGRIEEIEFDLPIPPDRVGRGTPAPAGVSGTHALRSLSCEQFVELAYRVRCNLLHGSSDPDEVYPLLRKVSRAFATLVWNMIVHTPR